MEEFLLGADPEFGIKNRRNGRSRTARDVIHDPDPHSQKVLGAAIGLDGDRPTASLELRPGTSMSGEELVHRMGDLIVKLRNHYHPPGIAYISGPWLDPEPFGGHIHISWTPTSSYTSDWSKKAWQISELLQGISEMSVFLTNTMFDPKLVKIRTQYAHEHGRDFANPKSTRPSTIEEILASGHVEYRYPPSWLMSPESAYCFLGGAEVIVREVFSAQLGKMNDWYEFTERMFKGEGISPPNSPSLATAFTVAQIHKFPEDFTDNWVDE